MSGAILAIYPDIKMRMQEPAVWFKLTFDAEPSVALKRILEMLQGNIDALDFGSFECLSDTIAKETGFSRGAGDMPTTDESLGYLYRVDCNLKNLQVVRLVMAYGCHGYHSMFTHRIPEPFGFCDFSLLDQVGLVFVEDKDRNRTFYQTLFEARKKHGNNAIVMRVNKNFRIKHAG